MMPNHIAYSPLQEFIFGQTWQCHPGEKIRTDREGGEGVDLEFVYCSLGAHAASFHPSEALPKIDLTIRVCTLIHRKFQLAFLLLLKP